MGRILLENIKGPPGPNTIPTAAVVRSIAGEVFPSQTTILYDGAGNVASVTESGITTTYTYNADETVATDTRLGVTRAYSYDSAGNLAGIQEIV